LHADRLAVGVVEPATVERFRNAPNWLSVRTARVAGVTSLGFGTRRANVRYPARVSS